MIECTSRQDRLYVLATVCKQKNVTPNSNTYMTIIQTVCCGKFLLSKVKARELASTLTSAYRHDHWSEILGENQPLTNQTEEPIQQTTHQKEKFTPKQEAKILCNLAKKDTYNGVGRLQLYEVQSELGQISPKEILETWMNIYPDQTIERRGNVFLIYWEGKAEVKNQRSNLTPIVPKTLVMAATKDYHVEPELEKDSESANNPSDKIICGEVSMDDSGVVDAEGEDLGEG